MERLNDDAQWIILMGFIVSVGMLFLTIIISQAPLVGQTTAEGVLEFPKSEIQDMRAEIIMITKNPSILPAKKIDLEKEMKGLTMARQNAVMEFTVRPSGYGHPTYDLTEFVLHYNNGVTDYDETYTLFMPKT
jgi:hypothetical protein